MKQELIALINKYSGDNISPRIPLKILGVTSQPIDFDNIPIQTTIGNIKKNVAILQLSEEEFINTIQQRIPPTLSNYLSIVEKNITGDFSDVNPIDLEAGANRCAIP